VSYYFSNCLCGWLSLSSQSEMNLCVKMHCILFWDQSRVALVGHCVCPSLFPFKEIFPGHSSLFLSARLLILYHFCSIFHSDLLNPKTIVVFECLLHFQ